MNRHFPGRSGEGEDGCVKEGWHGSTSKSSAIRRTIMLMSRAENETFYRIPHRKETKEKSTFLKKGGRPGFTATSPVTLPW